MPNFIINQTEYEEGFKPRPYYCSEGYPTVGYGFRIGEKGAPLPEFYLPRSAADVWLIELLTGTEAEMRKRQPINDALTTIGDNEPRRAVLISMAYQLGAVGLLAFTKTLDLIRRGDYSAAAREMLNSRWAKQTPERAARHAQQLRSGVWAPEYGFGG
jgi:lysozyme